MSILESRADMQMFVMYSSMVSMFVLGIPASSHELTVTIGEECSNGRGSSAIRVLKAIDRVVDVPTLCACK